MNQNQRGDLSRGAVRTVGYALICLPILASFLYVRGFGVNVPITDTWVMAPLFEKLFSGELGVGDLWAQHSEHRPFLPRIFLLLMGPLADFNIVTIMYATQLCLLATFVCVFLAYRDTMGLDSKSLFFAVPVSLLVFSLGQYWNMLHAWSIHVVMVNSFGILSFLLLSKLRGKGRRLMILLFLASVLSASAATLSAGHGLLIWPVGLVQLSLVPILLRRKKYLLAAWALMGVVQWVVYFWDYKSAAHRMSETYFFNSSTMGVDYFLGLIGSALFAESLLAVAAGLAIGVTFALVLFWMIRDRQLARHTFWISLSAYSLLTLAATTLGRGGQGLGENMPSKYVTFSVLLTISVYVMALKLARDFGPSKSFILAAGVCSALIIMSAPLSYYSAVQTAETSRIAMEKKAFLLLHYENRTNRNLAQAFKPQIAARNPRTGKRVRHDAAVFDNLNYTVFSDPASEADPAARHSKR